MKISEEFIIDTEEVFARGLAARERGDPQRIFDWLKAVNIIIEHESARAEAGLLEDWGYTAGTIWDDYGPIGSEFTAMYLGSNWATPVIKLDGETIFECWLFEQDVPLVEEIEDGKKYLIPMYDASTVWPPEALELLSKYYGRKVEITFR